ncbi:hypothetical protein AXX17_AT3G18550 [Arabidopsis thaliana]|uniref:Uncharacterized protein n=1 Tax=Arabidopsis thaliana TaxID=3702 RepID=A0A178VKR2_ARATH|nr:hypothetical protein AXX17_AT3G18550 [Arabidopsis thaliana]
MTIHPPKRTVSTTGMMIQLDLLYQILISLPRASTLLLESKVLFPGCCGESLLLTSQHHCS